MNPFPNLDMSSNLFWVFALKTPISFSSTPTLISSIYDFGDALPPGNTFGSKVKTLPEDKNKRSLWLDEIGIKFLIELSLSWLSSE